MNSHLNCRRIERNWWLGSLSLKSHGQNRFKILRFVPVQVSHNNFWFLLLSLMLCLYVNFCLHFKQNDMTKYLREDLHRRLLSPDFKKQVEGLEMLQKVFFRPS